ncbi:ATP-dependent acyl-CoA ligase [Mycobacterium sp. 20KCMC460]|uniref:AMP-binding protein n=1 Tax=Mycobacterium sp. 20KCMC460 TaxID=2903536 RepID=UPI001EE225C8|nr:AMP-binding protein [Mycobacterium sp. 20KCMC460]BDE15546.1 ATP-dependent acyl-CoA ligase [Mycobacterium sp. 20KCMC460]
MEQHTAVRAVPGTGQMLSLGELLRVRAAELPDRAYLTVSGRGFTFAELDARSDAVASALHANGVRAGDRVALLTPNRPEVAELFFGLAKLGAIQVPLNAALKGDFLRYQLSQSGASIVVVDAECACALAPVLPGLTDLRLCVLLDGGRGGGELVGIEWTSYSEFVTTSAKTPRVTVNPSDTMTIMYTSGTTGFPKGCLLSHGYYQRAALAVGRGVEVTEHDVLFTTLPMFHAAAMFSSLIGGLVYAIPAVIEPAFSARNFMTRAAEVNATVAFAVGAMGNALLATPPSPADRAHRLRTMVVAPLAPQSQQAFRDRFGIIPHGQMYGQTECMPITCTRLSDARDMAGCGAPVDDLELALLDDDDRPVPRGQVGEIAIRPRDRFVMFDGYWDQPDATLRAFRNLWYHTGDSGRFLPSGQLEFIDRRKDALRRRGENISSMQVEAAIRAHPKVVDVAVHGVASALSEDDVKACIVLAEGAAITPEELFAFFCEQVPSYAIPRYVEFLDDLPRTAVGRVMKYRLRERPVDENVWDFEGAQRIPAGETQQSMRQEARKT